MARYITRAFLILCSALVCIMRAQIPEPKLRTRPAVNPHHVFDVIARVHSGAAQQLSNVEALRVRIDGKQVPAASLTITQPPPQVMFVLDAINTPRGDLARSQQALLAWLHAAGERLPCDTSILIAADTRPTFKNLPTEAVASWELIKNELYVARLSPFRNPVELAAKLDAYELGFARLGDASQALSGNERVHISLQALSFLAAAMKEAPVPKLVLWISPGWPSVHLTEDGLSGQIFDSITYFNDALFSGRVLLYALDPTGAATDRPAPDGDALLATRPGAGQSSGALRAPVTADRSDFYRNFLEPVRSQRQAEPNNMLLQLAGHSGGTVQVSSNDLLGGIARFAADAGYVFTVTVAPEKRSGKETFHAVQVAGTDDKLRTTAGFYGR